MDFRLILLLAVLPCAACSTILGTDQQISVTTDPAGASCSVIRRGEEIARIDDTPGTVTIDPSSFGVTVQCEKAGFLKASYLNGSRNDNLAAMNPLTGWTVDFVGGADYRHDSAVKLTLVPSRE